MVNAPQVSLKVIVGVHFILTVWASMMEMFLPTAYIYMNAFILAFGVWGIIAPDSVESIFMFFALNLASIFMDVVFLGLFTSHANKYYDGEAGQAYKNTYRFALGMAILNLLLKPFTSFILYRLHQDRGGAYGDFAIPGMPNFGVGGGHGSGGGYENIDQTLPHNSMDSGSPSHGMDKSPLP